MSRRRARGLEVNAEINVVSLIDVMMLLMVIFMIAAPMMQGGVDVTLPVAQSEPLTPKSGLVVSVDRTGAIFIDKDAVTFEEFAGSIGAIAERRGRDGVYLRADAAVTWGQLAPLLGAMQAAGVENLGMVTEPEPRR